MDIWTVFPRTPWQLQKHLFGYKNPWLGITVLHRVGAEQWCKGGIYFGSVGCIETGQHPSNSLFLLTFYQMAENILSQNKWQSTVSKKSVGVP